MTNLNGIGPPIAILMGSVTLAVAIERSMCARYEHGRTLAICLAWTQVVCMRSRDGAHEHVPLPWAPHNRYRTTATYLVTFPHSPFFADVCSSC